MVKPAIGIVRRANPKPAPEAPAAKPEPKGLPKPIAAPQRQEDPDVAAAKAAVENFEVQRRVLGEMKEDWEKNFPEANQARQDILRQEDVVMDAIAKAKPLIAKIKQSIGEFTAQRKYSKPRYDDEEVTKILASLENRLEVFDEMLSSGIVSAIGLNREAALAWFAQRPTYAEAFQPAFKDTEEQTCAVSVPKF
jgi:hypothetical protein